MLAVALIVSATGCRDARSRDDGAVETTVVVMSETEGVTDGEIDELEALLDDIESDIDGLEADLAAD
jgi:hypothetical protein